MKVFCVLPYAYGKGTAQGSLIKLHNHVRAVARAMHQNHLQGGIILVNSSSSQFYNLSTAAAKTASPIVEDIKGEPGFGHVGYNRFLGLKHAFEIHNADAAVIQNADGHHRAEAVADIAQELDVKDADMAVGVRPSIGEVARLLLAPQFATEVNASSRIARYFDWHDILMEDGTPDFISGCSGFSRKGWKNFQDKILPHLEDGDPLGKPAEFDLGVPPLFRSFGLKVIPVRIKINSRIDHLAPEELDQMNGDPKLWSKKTGVLRDAETVLDFMKTVLHRASKKAIT